MRERLKQEYSRRLRMILKCELNARNEITATGALAVHVEVQFWYNKLENWRNKKRLTGKLERR